MKFGLKKVLALSALVILLVVSYFGATMALDMRQLFRNRDADYDFAQGPGGDITPPPDDEFREWEPGDEEDLDSGNEDDYQGPEAYLGYVMDPERVNILLIGVDDPGKSRRAPLSDSIMIFSFHKKSGDPVLMSIPRDTYVMIPGRYKDKINHSHAFGGSALLRASVEEFTGVPIDYYLRVNFEGFKGVVDLLGGVEIYVDRNIRHLKKGSQVLNGEDALTLVRFRSEPRGDFARVERQQRFLVAMAKQVQSDGLYRLPSLINEGVKYVDTDMPLLMLLDFANRFSAQDPDSLTRYVVTGRGFKYNRVYYTEPNTKAMREFIRDNMMVETE